MSLDNDIIMLEAFYYNQLNMYKATKKNPLMAAHYESSAYSVLEKLKPLVSEDRYKLLVDLYEVSIK